ncbi:MAG: DUF6603 domain-containing protein [Ginsengibacter sp.]
MADKDTLSIIAEEIASAFIPLKDMVESENSFRSSMKILGWDATQAVQPITDLVSLVDPIITLLESGEINFGNITQLLSLVKNLVTGIEGIVSKPDSLFSGITATASEFKNDFPEEIGQYVLVEYFLNQRPKVGSLLQLLGIITTTPKPATATRPAYNREELHFDKIGNIFSDPLKLLQELYGWATPGFDKETLFENLAYVLEGYHVPFNFRQVEDTALQVLNNGLPPGTFDRSALTLVLIDEQNSNAKAGAGINFYLLPQNGSLLPGLAIMPYAGAEIIEDVGLTDSLTFKFNSKLDLTKGIAIVVRPGQPPQLISNLNGGSTTGGPDAKISLGLEYQKADGTPTIVFGSTEASRYEFQSASIAAAANLTTAGSKNVSIEFDLKGSKIIIKPAAGDSDGFLSKILPANGITLAFDLGFGFGIETGFYFKGSSGLEIELPAHLQLGPIEIETAKIGIKPAGGNIPLNIALDIKGALGPIEAVVQGMGLTGTFSFPADRKGNLGPVDFGLGFLPPKGVGLSIDAGIVKGGGFLLIDRPKGEYAGALQLSIVDTIQVSAIAIINTIMPDGSSGFSLLIIISVQFEPGISLSMGFFLSGLGGMLGINRTINVDALRAGVKNDAIEQIMFPQDIIANINTLLPQIKAIFPVKENQFIIGLMAKITWGVPSLVTIEFGIAIEFSNPVRLAILGVLKIVLPDEDAPILQLQVNFLGIIDFDKGYLSFDASIYNSHILTFTLEGDMALRLNWGNEKAFLLSVGGFHPSFKPPAALNVPNLKRLTLTILAPNPNLVLTAYFAVTSNTVQFGARIDFRYGISDFGVVGHLAFDVLFQFSPFKFICNISAGLEVKMGGSTLFSINLDFELSGPTPWNAKGTGSFSILFISIKVHFNVTWGDAQQVIEPGIAVLPKILEAFTLDANWTTELPSNRYNLVSLANIIPQPGHIVLQSFGTVKISQVIMPLKLVIDKFGNNTPADINMVDISAFRLGGAGAGLNDADESFAPSAYKNMSDDDKLKSPSYTKEKGGITVADTNTLFVDYAWDRDVIYDIKVSDFDPFPDPPPFEIDFSWFRLMMKGGAIGKSELSIQNSQKSFRLNNAAVTMVEEQFVLIDNSTLQQHSVDIFSGGTHAQANDVFDSIIKQNPSLKGKVSIASAYQLQ